MKSYKIKVEKEVDGFHIFVNGEPTDNFIVPNNKSCIYDIEKVINENILKSGYIELDTDGSAVYYYLNHEYNISFDKTIFEKIIQETNEEKISQLLEKLIKNIIEDINEINNSINEMININENVRIFNFYNEPQWVLDIVKKSQSYSHLNEIIKYAEKEYKVTTDYYGLTLKTENPSTFIVPKFDEQENTIYILFGFRMRKKLYKKLFGDKKRIELWPEAYYYSEGEDMEKYKTDHIIYYDIIEKRYVQYSGSVTYVDMEKVYEDEKYCYVIIFCVDGYD